MDTSYAHMHTTHTHTHTRIHTHNLAEDPTQQNVNNKKRKTVRGVETNIHYKSKASRSIAQILLHCEGMGMEMPD